MSVRAGRAGEDEAVAVDGVSVEESESGGVLDLEGVL